MIQFFEETLKIQTSASTYEKAEYDVYYRIFTPENIKADIILLPGICVNTTHYTEISYYFAENGYRVILIDQPGFGFSSGLRGGLDNYDSKESSFSTATLYIYYQVIDEILKYINKKTNIDVPKISLGDGIGGFLGLYHQNVKKSDISYVVEKNKENVFKANILINPIVSIKDPEYNWLEKFLITIRLKSGNLYLYDIENLKDFNLVSDLEKRFELFGSPLKSLNYIDYKLFLKASFKEKDLFNGRFLSLFNKQFCDNLLIFQSKNDFLSDYNELKTKFNNFEVENKTLIEYENYGHFILLEKDWKIIANQIMNWIDGVL